jgi:hypothetical protein
MTSVAAGSHSKLFNGSLEFVQNLFNMIRAVMVPQANVPGARQAKTCPSTRALND